MSWVDIGHVMTVYRARDCSEGMMLISQQGNVGPLCKHGPRVFGRKLKVMRA